MKQPPRQRLSFLNLFILLLASVASLATLAGDHSNGRTSEYDEWPRGETRQAFDVQIMPAQSMKDALGYSGEVYLEVVSKFHPEEQFQDAVWSITGESNTGDMISRSANFQEFGGDLFMEDDSPLMGDAIARIGRLCASNEMTDDDCVPCLDGCSLTIKIDRCESSGDDINSSEIRIVGDDGERFTVRCEKDEDLAPCTMLDSWLVAEAESLAMTICPDQGM
ncbi:MAG: hypothetical protein VYC39_20050 [Myxococcota bacterium]|nr:hypothetical protein [Myxococcota bacterium]